jgi:glycosyltransferase involved in cell wall biosynthesis
MRLSLCIATLNRADFIGHTLECLLAQATPDMEIVVVDGASKDDTEEVVARYANRSAAVRYFREPINSGVDADYDKAVRYADGEYCWLFTDDDELAPGANSRVMEALEANDLDLLVVDSEVRDAALTRMLTPRRLKFSGDRDYDTPGSEAFLRDVGYVLSFIGGVIIRRSLWLARTPESYFDSLFVHAGVIFGAPPLGRVKVIGEPLVRIRIGNAMWRPRGFEIWAFKWPRLIWSFPGYSPEAKHSVTPRDPWRRFTWLLGYRALGAYSLAEYRRYFAGEKLGLARLPLLAAAVFPGAVANLIGVCLLALTGRGGSSVSYDFVVSSRYSNVVSRLVTRPWLGDLTGRAARVRA